MKNAVLIVFAILLSIFAECQQLVTIRLAATNEVMAKQDSFYAAGSFNDWNPADEKFRFKKAANGIYTLTLPLKEGEYFFKITRGDWRRVECLPGGQSSHNRDLTAGQVESEYLVIVHAWQDDYASEKKMSTASSHVCILDTAFKIPQLHRSRRIWIYLPKSYCANEDTRYPVLYMHDGQNIFDDATSFSGEWGVDEFLDSTSLNECIVVAIDNGKDKRLNEYNPYDHAKYGEGEGKAYLHFLVKILKPTIDRDFRTLKGKESTFIAGSSMGGLISMYAMLQYPKTFGAAGIFSPAFWMADDKIFNDIVQKGKKLNGRLYFFASKNESEEMVPQLLKAVKDLTAVSKSKITAVIRNDGKHNEATWRKEFPLFYEWLTGNAAGAPVK